MRHVNSGIKPRSFALAALVTSIAMLAPAAPARGAGAEEMARELKSARFTIVYETWQGGNWELFAVNPDGSRPVNLTRTPKVNELYPHVSPDGTKVVFSVDSGQGKAKTRSVYYMNTDGTGRTLVAHNARQACWKGDGTAIAYLKGLSEKLDYRDYATKGIFVHDLKTKTTRQHVNKKIRHLYNLCWSPDGKWFLATVHAGMGYKHAILAIEADGQRVFNLGIRGCRPDISPDGKQVTWGQSDWVLCAADLDLSGAKPTLTNKRAVVTSRKPIKIYHSDFSPDGKYIAYSTGPTKKRLGLVCEIVGMRADGWNIAVADARGTNRTVVITRGGKSNKEPDWAPLREKRP